MAEEDLKVLLRENIELSKESLKILKKINRGGFSVISLPPLSG